MEGQTKKIIDYLDGVLSDEELRSFEKQLQSDDALQNELNYYETLIQAAKEKGRDNLRTELASYTQSYKKKRRTKQVQIAGWSTIGVAASLFLLSYFNRSEESPLLPTIEDPPVLLDSATFEKEMISDTIKTDTTK